MSPLAELLDDLARALATAGRRFALVGGLAVSVRTDPRFTRDVDLAVAVADDHDAEAVVGLLRPRYELLASLEHEALARLAAVGVGRAGHLIALEFLVRDERRPQDDVDLAPARDRRRGERRPGRSGRGPERGAHRDRDLEGRVEGAARPPCLKAAHVAEAPPRGRRVQAWRRMYTFWSRPTMMNEPIRLVPP